MIISPIPTPTFNPPTPSFADPHVTTNVLMALLSREDPEIPNVSQFRTTTSIVLSSLTTIFTCTWVALHLDTPRTSKSCWSSFWRRCRWMIAALIAPEVIAGNAMAELLVAKQYKELWNENFVKLCSPELVTIPGKTTTLYKDELEAKHYDSRWTLTHGFLAGMGGIRFYDSRAKPREIGRFGGIRFYDSRAKLKPRKFRPKQKHFDDCNMLSVIQQIGLVSEDNITDKSKGDGITKFFVVLQTTWFIIQCLARWAVRLPVTELEAVTLAYAVLNIFIYALWWHKPQSLGDPFRVFVKKEGGQVPGEVGVKGTSEEVNASSRSGGVTKPSHLPNELKWVEPIYSGIPRFFISQGNLGPMVFMALSGTIFGAPHLFPLWLSVFPSDIERKLWQISAFYVAVAPLGTLATVIVVALLLRATWLSSYLRSDPVEYVLFFCGTIPYGVARVILLVLTFTTLRSLPTEAFRNVEWTRFIPHF